MDDKTNDLTRHEWVHEGVTYGIEIELQSEDYKVTRFTMDPPPSPHHDRVVWERAHNPSSEPKEQS